MLGEVKQLIKMHSWQVTELRPKSLSLTFLSFQLFYYGTRVTMCPLLPRNVPK